MSLDFLAKKFLENCPDSNKMVIFTYNLKTKDMKKLGQRNYLLISQGVNMTGTYDPNKIFFYFEESLNIKQAQTIFNFLEWVHKNGKFFGIGNYEVVFKEFLNSLR